MDNSVRKYSHIWHAIPHRLDLPGSRAMCKEDQKQCTPLAVVGLPFSTLSHRASCRHPSFNRDKTRRQVRLIRLISGTHCCCSILPFLGSDPLVAVIGAFL